MLINLTKVYIGVTNDNAIIVINSINCD